MRVRSVIVLLSSLASASCTSSALPGYYAMKLEADYGGALELRSNHTAKVCAWSGDGGDDDGLTVWSCEWNDDKALTGTGIEHSILLTCPRRTIQFEYLKSLPIATTFSYDSGSAPALRALSGSTDGIKDSSDQRLILFRVAKKEFDENCEDE